MPSIRPILVGSLLFVTTAAAQQPPPPVTIQVGATTELKSPTVARILGILPGIGHMYAGEVEHGLFYAAAIPSLVLAGALAGALDCLSHAAFDAPCPQSPVFTASLIAAGGLWAWSIFDAGRAARRTNAKLLGRTSLLLEPSHVLVATGDDRIAVRLGLRLSTR